MELHEILTALKEGKTVHWSNTGYVVVLDDLDKVLVIFNHNGYATELQPSEYEDCFIAREAY